jgi:tRNA-dihydrouridine synthase
VNTGILLPPPSVEERVAVCKKHLIKSYEWKGPVVGINEMRRHYTNYLKGMPGIKEYRLKLVTLKDVDEIMYLLDEIVDQYSGYEFERSVIELINYHEKCAV